MNTKLKEFFINMLNGFVIGFAFIIPGFSGGTVAVILGIYDKMINAITNLFKEFKKSIIYLMPIAIGMVLAFGAMYFPIYYALMYIPFPTICLFVGLMLGGMPGVLEKAKGKPDTKFKLAGNIIAGVAALCIAVGICFLPASVHTPNLTESMVFTDYVLLFLVCFVAACALVVPGISGSMILMIFGYYTPIMYGALRNIFTSFGHNFLVLAVAAFGILVGFFAISFLMRFLLKKFPRGTYYAIIGFVLGSAIAIFYLGASERFSLSDGLPLIFEFSPLQIALAAVLGLVGFAGAFIFYYTSKKRIEGKQLTQPEQNIKPE